MLVPHGADTRMALAAVLAVTAKIFRYEPTGTGAGRRRS